MDGTILQDEYEVMYNIDSLFQESLQPKARVERCIVMMYTHLPNTVKPLFFVFVGGLKKKQWIRESNRCGSHS
jgi:hypothetical protein